MNRRKFLKFCAWATAAGISPAKAAGLRLSNNTLNVRVGRRLPNVIYILADDLGYRELGCYGQQKIRTPNLDKMAAEGIRFTQHYTGNSICAPARGSVMCGKHMGHAFIRDNHAYNGYQLPLPADTTTVAHIFKQAGYATGAMGKWGLGGPGTTGHPNKMGFDLFFGYLGQAQAHYYYPPHLWRNDEKIDLKGNNNRTGEIYSHDLIVEEALGFIGDNRNRPFFLFLPFTIPHVSLQVPQDSLDEYLQLGWPETPYPEGQHYTPHDTPKAAYAAMITRMDDGIGRIMALLKKFGIDEDTLVIFTSDNGTTYCCGVDYDFFDSVGELRGLKGSLYEGGIREPMIARWPGKIRPGATTDHISAFYDFLPMACELTGQPIPDWTDGISFLPRLLGQHEKQQQHEYLYWEKKSGGWQAVRMGKWKGIRRNVQNTPNPVMQLHDLDNDISESNDVASANPGIVAQIEQIMAQAHTYSSNFPLLYGE